MHQRAALRAREDSLVNLWRQLRCAEDERAAWPAQGLVGSGGDNVAVGHRIGIELRNDEACDVGDVGHEVRADGVGDLTETGEIEPAWIGREASDDQLR